MRLTFLFKGVTRSRIFSVTDVDEGANITSVLLLKSLVSCIGKMCFSAEILLHLFSRYGPSSPINKL